MFNCDLALQEAAHKSGEITHRHVPELVQQDQTIMTTIRDTLEAVSDKVKRLMETPNPYLINGVNVDIFSKNTFKVSFFSSALALRQKQHLFQSFPCLGWDKSSLVLALCGLQKQSIFFGYMTNKQCPLCNKDTVTGHDLEI